MLDEIYDSGSTDDYYAYSLFINSKSEPSPKPEIFSPVTSAGDSQRRLRDETICQKNILEIMEPQHINKLTFFYDKYKNFEFPSPYKEFNKLPPEFKACLAWDKQAIETFLLYGWNINSSYAIPHGKCCSPLAYLIDYLDVYHLSLPKLSHSNREAIADMCLFLIQQGANVNSAGQHGLDGGFCRMIRTLHNAGERGIDVIKTAIEHGANLHGSLKCALNLPENINAEYKDRIIEILLNSGAKLDG